MTKQVSRIQNLKVLGITRKIDELNRITIPAEIRFPKEFEFYRFEIIDEYITLTPIKKWFKGCRCIDAMGRFVIPIETVRDRNPGWEKGDKIPYEIFMGTIDDEPKILLREYKPGCIFCSKIHPSNIQLKGKQVCETCLDKLIIRRD